MTHICLCISASIEPYLCLSTSNHDPLTFFFPSHPFSFLRRCPSIYSVLLLARLLFLSIPRASDKLARTLLEMPLIVRNIVKIQKRAPVFAFINVAHA